LEFRREVNEEFAAKLRSFLDENYPQEWRENRFEWPFDWDFHRKFTAWQNEYLPEAGPAELNAFGQELDRADVELRSVGTNRLVANTIAALGTPEQLEQIVPKMVNGEILAVLGYTEPDSGSDAAAASTRAERDGDQWVINGQKMFTSNAHIGTHVFLLTRTSLSVPKHAGLTMFLVPLNTPGVDIHEVKTLRGHRTNMTFYTDVRVPDFCRIGDVDGGWKVMRVALDFEHAAGAKYDTELKVLKKSSEAMESGSRLELVLRKTLDWARSAKRDDGSAVIDDPFVRERIARAAIEVEVARLLGGRNDETARLAGVGNGTKLYASETYVRAASDLLDLAGPAGLLQHTSPGAVAGGWPEYSFRDAQVNTIAGGCSEVQRDVIAERRFGLKRMRPAVKA
jgi:alkylation response protein AidB-like acyl-CoA dehydrogenase